MISFRHAALLLLLAAIPLYTTAQTVLSPNDPIYDQLRIWEQRGLIDWLPPLRPLPAPIVRSALQQVANLDHATDRQLARSLIARYFTTRPVQVQLAFTRRSKVAVTSEDEHAPDALPAQLAAEITSGLELMLNDRIGFGFTARPLANSVTPAPVIPLSTYDSYAPIGTGDDTTILGEDFYVDVALSGNVYLGSSALSTRPGDWYLQAGFGRSSFGFSDDSAIVSSSAPPAGYLSGTYRGDWMAYSALFLELIAEHGICSVNTIEHKFCTAEGEIYSLLNRAREQPGFHPSKYLVVQSLSFYPTDWLELTALNSVIFGGRLSPTYLLPVFPSLITQMQLGNYDNAFVGAAARLRLPYGASASAVLYVDDVNFTKMRRFNFDSDQNKMALDIEASIAPSLPILTVISARYRMVTPYLYAHHPSTLDYLQYTHAGHHLGTLLDPNSDEITVNARGFPAEWLTIDLSLRRVRHGGPDGGSIWDHGWEDNEFVFTGPSTFLKPQPDHAIEHLLQARAGADLRVKMDPVELHFGLTYTYEQVHNRNLVPGANETAHLVEVSTAVRY